jgi:hypothetical protein
LVAETLRAALNELATVVPDWLQRLVPLEWYERYGKRIEDTRLPRNQAAREAYARTVGEDGFRAPYLAAPLRTHGEHRWRTGARPQTVRAL